MCVATAALIAAGVGTAISAVSAISNGIAASNAADYNSQVAGQNAVAARQQSAQDAMLLQRQSAQQIGAARAAYGAAGVTADGSAGDVLAMNASNAELARQTILYKGNLRAAGYDQQVVLAQAAGDNAMMQGFMQAGSSLLLGGSKMYEMWPVDPNAGGGEGGGGGGRVLLPGYGGGGGGGGYRGEDWE